MELAYSFIIPVYNRPHEIKELLESMTKLVLAPSFEVVIVEDGSQLSSERLVKTYSESLNIKYIKKPNTGPGDSRNLGMKMTGGNYYIILDSDVILPKNYLSEVEKGLRAHFAHCFGGPDAAHEGFTDLQKAINYAMTSFLTTGGIRGGKSTVEQFQPRSFNMGLSQEAFLATGGFGRIHPGEDPDLALRLQEKGFKTCLFPDAFVYHKRRIDWKKFFIQVKKFGMVRPILNKWHPASAKLVYWFPSLFTFGLITAIALGIFGDFWMLYCYICYFMVIFFHSYILNRNLRISLMSVAASLIQFLGYGFGYCKTTYYLRISNADPEKQFPQLFFKNVEKY